VNESAGQKLWKRRAQNALGNRRSDFHFSHSFNNNKLDDRNHFLQNAKTSVASLRRLITPTRNADHDQPGTLIIFIGIRKVGCSAVNRRVASSNLARGAKSSFFSHLQAPLFSSCPAVIECVIHLLPSRAVEPVKFAQMPRILRKMGREMRQPFGWEPKGC
jgi:hypothetical protein